MARTIEQILKEQLGNLLFEVAILTSRLEATQEELKNIKLVVREPDKNPPIKE